MNDLGHDQEQDIILRLSAVGLFISDVMDEIMSCSRGHQDVLDNLNQARDSIQSALEDLSDD